MSTETQRAEFEEWARSRGYQRDELARGELSLVKPNYYETTTEEAWSAWQAAQSSQAAELAAPKADIAELVRITAEQATEIERLNDLLSFVERWANHHARKPSVSAENALSVIQHHPSIKKITKSYTDGVAPTTRDPYAEIEALRKDAELWKHWRPWLERRVGDLSKYNAAMQTKEAS